MEMDKLLYIRSGGKMLVIGPVNRRYLRTQDTVRARDILQCVQDILRLGHVRLIELSKPIRTQKRPISWVDRFGLCRIVQTLMCKVQRRPRVEENMPCWVRFMSAMRRSKVWDQYNCAFSTQEIISEEHNRSEHEKSIEMTKQRKDLKLPWHWHEGKRDRIILDVVQSKQREWRST